MKRRLKIIGNDSAKGGGPFQGSPVEPESPDKDGFSMHFSGGRGVLRLTGEKVSPAVTVDLLEMNIPQIAFPFDVSRGVRGLRDRRLKLSRLVMTVSLDGLIEAIGTKLGDLDWIDSPMISFEEDCISVLLEYGPEGTRVPFSFRLLPSGEERLPSLLVDEPRAYGPVPMSLLLVAGTVLREVTGARLEGVGFHPPDPLKEALMAILPARGWRLPDYSDAALVRLDLEPDRAVLEFSGADLRRERGDADVGEVGMSRLRRLEELRLTRDGDRLLGVGELEEARASYARLLDREPENPVAAARLAMIDVMDPQMRDTARALASEALARRGQRTDILAVVAHGAALEGDVEEETKALEMLLESSFPLERLAAGLRLGELARKEDPDRAITFFEGALAARREDPRALIALIETGAAAGRKDMVDRLISRWIAVHRTPASRARAHAKIGELLLRKLGDPAASVKHLERAALAQPGNSEIMWGLAQALAGAGDDRRAISRFERLEKISIEAGDLAGAARAMESIGKIWMCRGEPELAVPRLREALDAHGEMRPPATMVDLAAALGALGQFAEAADVLESALSRSRPMEADFPWGESALDLARIYFEELDDAKAAEQWIRAAMTLKQSESSAGALMRDMLERQGRWTELARSLERVLGAEPSVENVLALNRARINAGEVAAAVSTLETALERHPEREDLRDAFIDACREAGEQSRLKAILQKRFETCVEPGKRAAMATEIGSLELTAFENPQASANWFRLALDEDQSILEARKGLVDALGRLGGSDEMEMQMEALERDLSALGRRSDAAALMARRAAILAEDGESGRAADLMRKALPDLPGEDRCRALIEMATLYQGSGDHSTARDLYVAARREHGVDETYVAALGEAQTALEMKDYPAALEAATIAGSGPVELRTRAAMAAAKSLVHLDRSTEAARILERVAENADARDSIELFMLAAEIYRHQVGDNVRALEMLERLLEIDPKHDAARKALVDSLERSGDRSELARGLVRFAEEGERGIADLMRAADFFSAEGLHEDAASALRIAYGISPDPESARMLAGALRRCGAFEEMVAVLKEFVATDDASRRMLAVQLEEMSRHGELAELLGSAREEDADRERDRLAKLAETLADHLGDRPGAIDALLEVLSVTEDAEQGRDLARRILALAREEEDFSLLASCLERVERFMPPSPRAGALFELSGLRWMSGDREGAREPLRKGLKLAPENLPALFEMARRFDKCDVLLNGAVERAMLSEQWEIADEMLSLIIEASSDEGRPGLLRRRAAIRRGRLGDEEGAVEDMLSARAAGALPEVEMEELIDMLEARGDVGAAAEVAAEIAQGSMKDGRRLARAARLAQEAGNHDSAVKIWRQAISVNPDPAGIVSLVKLLDTKKDGEELEKLLDMLKGQEDLLDIPDHMLILEVVVDLDLARGQDLDAVEGLVAMMDLDPGKGDPWQKMVHILERRGEWEALAKRMEERLTLAAGPDDVARTSMALGLIFDDKLGNEDGAVAAFERVLSVVPEHPGANRMLAAIAFRRQRWDQLDKYLSIIETTEWNTEIELWRARTAENLDRPEEAGSIFEEIVRREPGQVRAVEGLMRVLTGPQHDAKVIEVGRNLIEGVGREKIKASVHRRVGLAHKRSNEPDAAIERLEYADRISGGDPESLKLLVDLHGEAGRHEKRAELLCKLAYMLEGSERAARLVEASRIYLEKLFDEKRAYHWLTRASEMAPDDPDVLLALADCAWVMKEAAVVVRSLERFRLVAPQHPPGPSRTYHLAASLAVTRDWPIEDIIETLEQVVDRLGSEERQTARTLVGRLRAELGKNR